MSEGKLLEFRKVVDASGLEVSVHLRWSDWDRRDGVATAADIIAALLAAPEEQLLVVLRGVSEAAETLFQAAEQRAADAEERHDDLVARAVRAELAFNNLRAAVVASGTRWPVRVVQSLLASPFAHARPPTSEPAPAATESHTLIQDKGPINEASPTEHPAEVTHEQARVNIAAMAHEVGWYAVERKLLAYVSQCESRQKQLNRSFDALRSERDHYAHEASRLGRSLEQAEREAAELRERMDVVLHAGPSTSLAVHVFDRAKKLERERNILQARVAELELKLNQALIDEEATRRVAGMPQLSNEMYRAVRAVARAVISEVAERANCRLSHDEPALLELAEAAKEETGG